MTTRLGLPWVLMSPRVLMSSWALLSPFGFPVSRMDPYVSYGARVPWVSMSPRCHPVNTRRPSVPYEGSISIPLGATHPHTYEPIGPTHEMHPVLASKTANALWSWVQCSGCTLALSPVR